MIIKQKKELGRIDQYFTMSSSDVQQKIKQAETTRKLDLSNSRINEELPPEIFKLVSLRTLNLYRNQLKSLPEQLWNLVNLTELNLYRNRISSTTFPAGISSLKFLKVLNLGSNNFDDVPVSANN